MSDRRKLRNPIASPYGDMRNERHDPAALWIQADQETLQTSAGWCERRSERYRELMIEYGHLVAREPGDPTSLPCGYDLRSNRTAHRPPAAPVGNEDPERTQR